MCSMEIFRTGISCLWVIAILIIDYVDNKRVRHDFG